MVKYHYLIYLSPLLCVATVNADDLADIAVARERRVSTLVGASTSASSIPSWLKTMDANGKFTSGVDYTTGCDAVRGSWPAQQHWKRVSTFAAAYHGGFKGALNYSGDATIREAIGKGMKWWFDNDLQNNECLDKGGEVECPCDTPGMWNTNWFSNIILIPRFVSQTCLLLADSLSSYEMNACQRITTRAYAKFGTGVHNISAITGTNTMDIASVGIDLALLTNNVTLLKDATSRVSDEVVIHTGLHADGILTDGSFGQHLGMLYNGGTYGRDYINDFVSLEISFGNTSYQAKDIAKNAFERLIDAGRWMIVRNTLTDVLHWDFNTIGRFLTFPVIDNQSSGSLKLNLTQIKVVGEIWNSKILLDVYKSLQVKTPSANAGPVVGNRMFFNNDYMVHRGANYVTALKMFSKRTKNSECTNSQNPFGFHLSDGTLYTYLKGNEYEDIQAAWDWNLIPGITIDYDANPLECGTVDQYGLESFVGGVSNGKVGVAAMRYTNPVSKSLQFQKSWFFLQNDVQVVMIAGIKSSTEAPVFSVLDQRRRDGDVILNGQVVNESGNFSDIQTLWHGGVGYAFDKSEEASCASGLNIELGEKTGSWEGLGTSSRPANATDLFAAWIDHYDTTAPISYTIFPGTSQDDFHDKAKSTKITIVENNEHISAVMDSANNIAMIVFWDTNGGLITLPQSNMAIKSSAAASVIVDLERWAVRASDPNQTLDSLHLTFIRDPARPPPRGWDHSASRKVELKLPRDGSAGDSAEGYLFKASTPGFKAKAHRRWLQH